MNLLSLDGGGVRGIIIVTILRRLCRELYGSDDFEATKRLRDRFDYIAGTSTGSIIAVGMQYASLSQIRDIYFKISQELFSGRYGPGRFVRYLYNSNYYDGDYLYEIIKREFGDNRLDDRVIILATDSTENDIKPVCLTSGSNITAAMAIRASCAAPTFFSPVSVDNRIYVDGGLTANNPTEVAIFNIHDRKKIKPKFILSVGTGTQSETPVSPGVVSLVKQVINLCTNSQDIHEKVKKWCDLMSDVCYIRLTPPKLGDIALDESDIAVLEKMERDTEQYIDSNPELWNQIKIALAQ